MRRIISRRSFLAFAGALILVACNEGPGYLDQAEEELGLREAWYGTDHRVFHAALLYPYGLGLRNSGYLVNLRHVLGVHGTSSLMVGGHDLLISRSRKKAFLAALTDYLGARAT